MDIQLTIRILTNCGENKQDSQHGWTFSSHGRIQRLTGCGENRNAWQDSQQGWTFRSQFKNSLAVKRTGMHGGKFSRDCSAHKAQFKDSHPVERTEMQGRTVGRVGHSAHNSKTHKLWGEQECKAGQSAGMDIWPTGTIQRLTS